ncbi:MAG: SPOR domain-containing protein, partial [Pseudomonadota bacterium]|nr:SPOR domain-containing protein [Pseudomonadota bacterium]
RAPSRTAARVGPAKNKGARPARAPAPHGGWTVQVGSFSRRVNAEKLLREVKATGAMASVTASGRGRRARYRVRAGPFAERMAAEQTIDKLKKDGFSSSLLPP